VSGCLRCRTCMEQRACISGHHRTTLPGCRTMLHELIMARWTCLICAPRPSSLFPSLDAASSTLSIVGLVQALGGTDRSLVSCLYRTLFPKWLSKLGILYGFVTQVDVVSRRKSHREVTSPSVYSRDQIFVLVTSQNRPTMSFPTSLSSIGSRSRSSDLHLLGPHPCRRACSHGWRWLRTGPCFPDPTRSLWRS
jgi:hypothetical protein